MDQVSGGESLDAILSGKIRLIQPRLGYRFSVEAILLARFASVKPRDAVLDLGAGCGVIALTIAALHRVREVTAVEIQPDMAAIVSRNAALNGVKNVRSICADLRARKIADLEPNSFDLVTANPPFFALRRGRESPHHSRRVARGESEATIDDFVRAARRFARNGGRAAFVFAASRLAELIATMRANRLEPKRIRFVHARVDLPAAAVLIEARSGAGAEVVIEPPLVLYDRDGGYSDEARALLESC